MGHEVEALVTERDYRHEYQGSDGHPWWEDTVCTSLSHESGMLFRKPCHYELYTSQGDKSYHVSSEDFLIELVETNLNLWD